MDLQIKSDIVFDLTDMDMLEEDIKDKYYKGLNVFITLDNHETLNLVEEIIKEETGIDLFEYGIKLGMLSLYESLEENEDMTCSEKKYVESTLKTTFGAAVLKDEITNTIKLILESENFKVVSNEIGDKCASFIIPFEDYAYSNVRKYIEKL